MFETTYCYGSADAHRAFVQWTWDRQGALVVWLGLVFAFAIAGMLSTQLRLLSVGIAGFICAYFCGLVLSYRRAGRNAGAHAESPITVRFSETGIALTTALGESALPWSAYSRADLTRDFLFLTTPRRQGASIPRTALSDDAVAFIQAKLGTRATRSARRRN